MSENLIENEGFYLTRYVGPATLGTERRCYQLTVPRRPEGLAAGLIQFTRDEGRQLARAICDDLGILEVTDLG